MKDISQAPDDAKGNAEMVQKTSISVLRGIREHRCVHSNGWLCDTGPPQGRSHNRNRCQH